MGPQIALFLIRGWLPPYGTRGRPPPPVDRTRDRRARLENKRGYTMCTYEPTAGYSIWGGEPGTHNLRS